MLIRQKVVIALLSRVNRSLTPTLFVKLMFLLRHETDLKGESTFYDFVPYKYGPFSFTLYRELNNLRRDGYVAADGDRVELCKLSMDRVAETVEDLPNSVKQAIDQIVRGYGRMSQSAVMKDIYTRYSWYSTKSDLTDLKPPHACRPKRATAAAYTAGYEKESVDTFLNRLLERGVELLIDVRANPVSRRYGFSKKQFSEIAMKLGLDYNHIPDLGIPSKYRASLKSYDSYQRLLRMYELEMLPQLENEINDLGVVMTTRPAVLVCVEKDVHCCHRSRLADTVSQRTGLPVMHL